MCTWHTDVNVDVVAVGADLLKGEAKRLAQTLMEHMRRCDEILMIKDDHFDTNRHFMGGAQEAASVWTHFSAISSPLGPFAWSNLEDD